MKKVLAFGGHADGGWKFEVWLIMGDVRGEVRIFEQGVLRAEQEIGVDEIAMFMARRMDLVSQFLEQILDAKGLGPTATKH